MARWLAASDLDRSCPDMASCKAQVLAIHGPPCSAVGGGDFPASASSALGVGGRCAGCMSLASWDEDLVFAMD